MRDLLFASCSVFIHVTTLRRICPEPQLPRVHHLKPQLREFLPRLRNHLLGPVHSQHFRAARGNLRRQRARPAPQIQYAFARLRRQQLHQPLRLLIHKRMFRVILRRIPLIRHDRLNYTRPWTHACDPASLSLGENSLDRMS